MGTCIEIRPVTRAIGAEVGGIDLREPLTDHDVATLRRALLDHLVLFFRDQHIDDAEQLAFALRFGPLHVSPLQTVHQDAPEIVVLDQVHPVGEGADEWHSDNTFIAEPPMASILRAVQLPQLGGDTCFASMYAAYEALSPPMRALLDGMRAVHDITSSLQKAIRDGHSSLDLAEMQQRCPPVEHNVVVTSGTGSGKTEAFLLPLLARIAEEGAMWGRARAIHPWWEAELAARSWAR